MPKTSELRDAFTDNNIDGTLWDIIVDLGGTVTEQNQRLELNVGANFAICRSKGFWDFSESFVFLHVTGPTAPTEIQMRLDVLDNQGDGYRMGTDPTQGGNLWLKRMQGFNEASDVGAISYANPDDHRWWMLSNVGDTVYMHTAANNGGSPGTWNLQRSDGIVNITNWHITNVKPRIYAQKFVDDNALMIVDGFNTSTAGSGGAIKKAFARNMRRFFMGV